MADGGQVNWFLDGLQKVFPMPSVSYLAYRRKDHPVVISNFLQTAVILPNFQHIRFGEFMPTVVFTTLMSAMMFFVSAVSALCVVSKIFNSIIGRIAVVVANIKTIWFSNERSSNEVGYFPCTANTILDKCDLVVTPMRMRFENPTTSPTTIKRPNTPKITDHVESFVSSYVLPDFLVHCNAPLKAFIFGAESSGSISIPKIVLP